MAAHYGLITVQDLLELIALKPTAVELAVAARVYDSPQSAPGSSVLTSDDERFLDDLQQRCLKFFIDEADAVTGLMPDRAKATGGASNKSNPASGDGKNASAAIATLATMATIAALCHALRLGRAFMAHAYRRRR